MFGFFVSCSQAGLVLGVWQESDPPASTSELTALRVEFSFFTTLLKL